jgi:hypothetical protein
MFPSGFRAATPLHGFQRETSCLAGAHGAAVLSVGATLRRLSQHARNITCANYVLRYARRFFSRAGRGGAMREYSQGDTKHGGHGMRRNVSSRRVFACGEFAAKSLRAARNRSIGATPDSEFLFLGASACGPSRQRPYWT